MGRGVFSLTEARVGFCLLLNTMNSPQHIFSELDPIIPPNPLLWGLDWLFLLLLPPVSLLSLLSTCSEISELNLLVSTVL